MRRAPNAWDRFYHFHATPWRGERRLDDWWPPLEGRVLELGCGNGKTLRTLQKRGVDVVGLDVSWNALQTVGGARVLADVAALPWAAGSFDVVLDLHCTGHLDAQGRARALGDIRRVLGPDGVLVQERLGPDDLRATQGQPTDEPHRRRLEDGRETAFLPPEVLDAELAAAGFAVERGGDRTMHPRIRTARVTRQSLWRVATAR